MHYFIYVLHSYAIDKYYVGYSSDPWLRLKQHLENTTDKYTGKAKDWQLQAVFFVSENEVDAIRVERFIKQQKSRNLIVKLLDPEFIPDKKLALHVYKSTQVFKVLV